MSKKDDDEPVEIRTTRDLFDVLAEISSVEGRNVFALEICDGHKEEDNRAFIFHANMLINCAGTPYLRALVKMMLIHAHMFAKERYPEDAKLISALEAALVIMDPHDVIHAAPDGPTITEGKRVKTAKEGGGEDEPTLH